MELFQVRYYLALSRTKNFTRAAEECNVSQPALSRAIQQLEAELGGELFRRERSLTHMTDLAHAVHPALVECFEANQNAKIIAQSFLKKGHAPLHLSLSRSIEMDCLSPVLGEITAAFPKIEIKIHRGPPQEISERMKTGDSEIAIAGTIDDPWDRLNARKLYEERYALLFSRNHAFAGRNSIELKDLAQQRILCRPNCWLAASLDRRLRDRFGVPSLPRHEAPLIDDLVPMVRANFGIGAWPVHRRVPEDLMLGHILDFDMSRWIQLYTVAGRKQSAAATTLVNLLRSRDWKAGQDPGRTSQESLH